MRGEIGATRNFEGDLGFTERAFGAHDALRDGGFGYQESASNFLRGESTEKPERERDTRFRGKHRMAGDKEQPQKIVAKVLFIGGVEFGFIVCHGGFLLGIEFAANLFVLPLQKLGAAKMIQS